MTDIAEEGRFRPMSAQTPSSERRNAVTAQPEQAPRAMRILALAAVCIGVAALAAATFVLSYSGIHVLALQAGITPRLARGYPLLIDAMLVIVLAAVLALRGAGAPSRLLAWLALLAVLAAAAGADALHAAGRKVPGHAGAITAAVLPWVLVFLAFALLLAMLRYSRLRRLAAARGPAATDDSRPGGPAARAVVADEADAPDREEPDLAIDADPPPDDPSSDETALALADVAMPDPGSGAGAEADAISPAPAADDGQDDPDMPVFHRMWSSPTPPTRNPGG